MANVGSKRADAIGVLGIETRISNMSGQYRALFLLAVFFWQSLAVLGSLSLLQHVREDGRQPSTEVHAFYQHHLDQSVHKNGELNSISHTHLGSVADAAVIFGDDAFMLPAPKPLLAFGQLAIALQTPILAGLLRPPKVLR